MKTIKQFCPKCGLKLIKTSERGSSVEVHMYDSGGGTWWKYTSPFDPATGEPKFVDVYRCPQYKTYLNGFFGDNSHEIFMVDGDNVEYGIRVKP